MCLRIFLPNIRNIVRVHVSYRAFLHGRPFHPDLTGSAAYEVGVDTDAKGARAHMAGQRFAEALHAQTTVDGILFSSRLTASPCVAIFDKAFAALTAPMPAALPRVPALTDETSRLGITVRRRRGTGRP